VIQKQNSYSKWINTILKNIHKIMSCWITDMILADERREAKREAKKWAEEQKYEEEAWKRQEKFLEMGEEQAPMQEKKPVRRKREIENGKQRLEYTGFKKWTGKCVTTG
jgi:hypothetical protein